ncbi:hypothetical protein AAZV13_03G161000 [Glycine max]|nr:hypothetical protein GYH30_007810 [Glycine max]
MFNCGKVDLTRDLRLVSKTRKWKKMFSGHWECWRIEWTATMEPRRYSTSRVMAMWTREGSQTEVKTKEAHLPLAALRNGAVGQREAEEAVEMVGGADVGAMGTKPERREKTTERNPC